MKRITKLELIGGIAMAISIPAVIIEIITRPEGLPLDYRIASSISAVAFAVGVYCWGRTDEFRKQAKA